MSGGKDIKDILPGKTGGRSATPAAVKADYAALADEYDDRWRSFNQTVYRWVMSHLPDIVDKPFVLDLGCGTGGALSLVAARYPGARLTGLDLSEEMIAQAQRRLPQATLITADVETADIGALMPADQYDIVFSLNILHHLNDPAAHMRCLRKACKKGGTVFLCDFALSHPLMRAADLWWRFKKASYNRAFRPEILQQAVLDVSRDWDITASAVLRPDWFWRLQIYKING